MNKYIAKDNGKIIASGEFRDEASFRLDSKISKTAIVEFTNKDAANLYNMYLDVRDKVLSVEYDYLESSSNLWIDSTIIASNKVTRDALRKMRLTILDSSFFITNKLLDVASAPAWAKQMTFRYSTAYKKAGEVDKVFNEWVDFINEWIRISK